MANDAATVRVSEVLTRAPLLAPDDVLSALAAWQREGRGTCLVTVVGIEGAGPRPVGAQMAVDETGRYFGYLSGGCLEQAVALEAQATIRAGKNRLVRYGKGSPYFDVRLPCGSGLDLYFDQRIDSGVLAEIDAIRARREPAVLRTNLTTGKSALEARASGGLGGVLPASRRDGDAFLRTFLPPVRLLLIGSGPSVGALARLAVLVGFELDVLSPDPATIAELRQAAIGVQELTTPTLGSVARPDSFTAVVLAFHEHDWEPPILAEALSTPAFYIGALGNRAVHAARLAALRKMSISAGDVARIRGPIGLVSGAKSRATLGLGIVT